MYIPVVMGIIKTKKKTKKNKTKRALTRNERVREEDYTETKMKEKTKHE